MVGWEGRWEVYLETNKPPPVEGMIPLSFLKWPPKRWADHAEIVHSLGMFGGLQLSLLVLWQE